MSTVPKPPKGLHEAFARFFEQPTRPALRTLIKENIGEFDHLDFKSEWPEGAALARHVLGLANSGGGVIVVGVVEAGDKSLSAEGLPAFQDKTAVLSSFRKYVPDPIEVGVYDFSFNESEYGPIKGKRYQVVLVEDRPSHLPFLCKADGKNIRAAAVYVRDGVATVEASHEQMQRIINRRISTGHSTSREMTLRDHLDELKALYDAIRERVPNPVFQMHVRDIGSVPNPAYPRQSMDEFVALMIDQKKSVIEAIVNVPDKER